MLILNIQTGLILENRNIHNERNEGKCTESAVGQDTMFIPQSVHHSLATQHEHQNTCNILFQLHLTDPHGEIDVSLMK